MGDVSRGVYVNAAIPDFLRDQEIPFANIITPNQFELLPGAKPANLADAVRVARQLCVRCPNTVVITSLATADIAGDELGTLTVSGEAPGWRSPILALPPLGACSRPRC